MTLEFLQFIRDNNTLTMTSIPNHTSHRKYMKYVLIKSLRNIESLTKSGQNTESDAVVILIIQGPFKRFHFRYRDLKVLNEVPFLTCRGREFQMTTEYMNDLRKGSQ